MFKLTDLPFFEMFGYLFMRKALLVGALLGIIIPCIGVIIVLKRLSMIGDALSHTSLAGVAIGLAAGINPVATATVVCVISAFAIELLRRKFPKYSELSIAIILSVGVGLASIFSGFINNAKGLESFLFGSIVLITDVETYLVIGVSVAVVVMFLLLYKELMHMTFSEESARLSGIPVEFVNFIFTILTAVTVSISSRTVGALVVSSLMVLPVAMAMQFAKSYKQTVILSVIFGFTFTIIGLTVSFYKENFKPGGTIVLLAAFALVMSFAVKGIAGKIRK